MQAVGDQSARQAPAVMGSSKLRYALRSAARSKDGKPSVPEPTVSSAPKRGRSSPAVSRSVNVLDLSGKDKSAKPSRRLSIPTKPAHPPTIKSMTPISEARARISNIQGKSDTPRSDISKSMTKRKFNVLSSVSYWLTQIKLSESASWHSISLGFFKLALESGCEPSSRVREELKSYIQRHNLLTEQKEYVKDLLQNYNIVEDLDKLNISESCSKLPEEVTQKSDKDRSKTRSMKPKSLNSENLAVVANSNNKDIIQRRQPTYKNRGLYSKDAVNCVPMKDTNSINTRKNSQKPRTKPVNENTEVESSQNPTETGNNANSSPVGETLHENKENTDVIIEETSCAEEIQVN
ncbi:unnamed protein product [Musa acuminata subsp. malaccensis]|uniref:(wild Malaysian banana) hypothetical protein n=1 Tax=Musa acuminata subsp. malaccensis TaxID=214687 RepID=A0A804I3W0_MUSAM|nr:PREDICTED: uncharacterized protein LOC103975432 isoform X2 [Musa acuminata subsp. malaccensis]CAG1862347.1 unnamed protein product [Musa acuminata subsp. malaccensis]